MKLDSAWVRQAPRSILLVTLLTLSACREPAPRLDPGSEPSPNASILPAPLSSRGRVSRDQAETGKTDGGGLNAADAGKLTPVSFATDRALPVDPLPGLSAEGLSLKAEFQWFNTKPTVPGAPVAPEALRSAQAETALKLEVQLTTSGRMRLRFASPAFPLPEGSELRTRLARFGHVLVWPDGRSYRVLPPGALRAALGERRADVSPLVAPVIEPAKPGHFLGFATESNKLSTAIGTLLLEQAHLDSIGGSGALLCRALVELVLADPETMVCNESSLPVRAMFEWKGGGRLGFEVKSWAERSNLQLRYFAQPPELAIHKPGELPPAKTGRILSHQQLRALRTKAVTNNADAPEAPSEGLLVENNEDILRYILLDGVPVAWVRARERLHLTGPRAGRYQLSSRDFFGEQVDAPKVVHLPQRIALGELPDAGTTVAP